MTAAELVEVPLDAGSLDRKVPVVRDEPMPAAHAPAIAAEMFVAPAPIEVPPPTLAPDAPTRELQHAVVPRRVLSRSAAPVPAASRFVPMAAGQQPARQPNSTAEGDESTAERSATAPQLRRFIKSRAYVPMHELRRRFGINGGDDEVTPVDMERTRIFVGLPDREGRLLGELLRGGDIGYELSLDPITPIVIGVYPMRPVTRG